MAKNMKLFYNKTKKEMKKQMENHKVDNERREYCNKKIDEFFNRQKAITTRIKEIEKALKKKNIKDEEKQKLNDELQLNISSSIDLMAEIKDFKEEYEDILKEKGNTLIYLESIGVAVIKLDKIDSKSVRKKIIKYIGEKDLILRPYNVAGHKLYFFHPSILCATKDRFFDEDSEDKEYDAKEFCLISNEDRTRGIKGKAVAIKGYDDDLEPILFSEDEAKTICDDIVEKGVYYDKEEISIDEEIKLFEISENRKMSDEEIQTYKEVAKELFGRE